MLIGISGSKRSGKDLTANIIKFICYESLRGKVYTEDLFNSYMIIEHALERFAWEKTWEVKKFADKLKDICCMLFGCTREQLEDESFKNSYLPLQWNTMPDHRRYTYREALQYIGTDLFRKQFHNDTWLNATFANYKKQHTNCKLEGRRESLGKDYPWWIISDVRFPNEADAVLNRGGILIRINRPNIKSDDTHTSETALNDYKKFSYIIKNNENLQDLINQVKKILEKEQIIK